MNCNVSTLREEAALVLGDAIDLRRRLHRRPEVGLVLPETQRAVLDALAGLPLSVTTGTNASSVVATLTGAQPGPTLLLRAEMDALPLGEQTGLPFASEKDGLMHACGHDAHTAMLVGATRVLVEHRGELAGSVRFMFQPGEEGWHGARVMIDEGLLDGPCSVSAAFALHVTPGLACGRVCGRPGTVLASTDDFTVTIGGRSGAAAAPHWALDPIPAACEIVLALQSLVTRRVNVFDPAVVTVSSIHGGGTADNVIAEGVRLRGTVRAVSETCRQQVLAGVRTVAMGIGRAHELDVDVEIRSGYPVTHNDPELAEWALSIARSLVGPACVDEMPTPSMSGDDFGLVLEHVPGAMLFLGARPPGAEEPLTLHSSTMRLAEDVIGTGIALNAALALAYLAG